MSAPLVWQWNPETWEARYPPVVWIPDFTDYPEVLTLVSEGFCPLCEALRALLGVSGEMQGRHLAARPVTEEPVMWAVCPQRTLWLITHDISVAQARDWTVADPRPVVRTSVEVVNCD